MKVHAALVLPAIILAFSIAIEMYLGGGMMQMLMVAGFAFGMFMMVALSDSLYSKTVKSRRELEDLESVSDSVHKGLVHNERFENALESSIEGISKRSECHVVLKKVAKIMRSGNSFSDAIRIVGATGSPDSESAVVQFLKRIGGGRYSPPTASSVGSEHRRLSAAREEMMEKNSGSVQRYITMSMVAGTTFPSFALFGFIGYSILDFSSFGVSVLIIALLVLIPGVYSIVRAKLAGVYDV